jgi:pimeloyl-ACP methyl ester carboxylesterase
VLHHVAVEGGLLAVEEITAETEPVLAIHGISSQRRLWGWLQTEAPEVSLIMPDLRGRAASIGVAGRSSMAQHADDMVRILDTLGLDAVHVCGMSMGGFVAVELAVTHPDRVRSAVLVDGGFPLAAPAAAREALPVLFRDRLARLEKRWASVDEYLAFFVANTAPLLDPADPLLRTYLEHDLDHGLVRLSGEALLGDAEDIYFGDLRWKELQVPTRLTHAEWSVGRGTPPGYSPDAVAAFREQVPALVATSFVPGVDHAGSIMSAPGAEAAATLLRDALRS